MLPFLSVPSLLFFTTTTFLFFTVSSGIINDDDFLDPFDPIKTDPIYDLTVFDPGSDVIVSAPGGLNRSLMIKKYGTSSDTPLERLSSMETPLLCLYNNSLFNDSWISEYGCSGTYELSKPTSIPAKDLLYSLYRSTSRNSYLKYFLGNLWIIGAWAFCPGPTWSNSSYPLSVQDCNFRVMTSSMISQPWINASLGAPNVYPRGAAGVSRDGGKSWKIVVADPRLARFGSNAVLVNGSDGTIDAALCLVGGTILPPYQPFTRDADFPITDSVLCTYDGLNWWENAPLPTPSAEHSLLSVGSSILVVGGLRPRNNSLPIFLKIKQDYMTDPPLLVSVLSELPCKLGAPFGTACIGYKGWAGFAFPPLSRDAQDLFARCTPLIHFLPGRGTSIHKLDTENFIPTLYIGGGNSLYNSVGVGQTDNYKDMVYLRNDTLSTDIRTSAEILFAEDPLSGAFDTFNNSLSKQLGSWALSPGSIPPAINFGNVFLHEITFGSGSEPCLSNSIITSICLPGDYFSAPRPMFIIIAGQFAYSDFFGQLLEFSKNMPVTHLTTAEPDYITNPLDKLESFYGQKVSELPNFGSVAYPNNRFANVISDSILISPSWNEGQPVIYFLQGGIRLLAAHFARCVFQHCTEGEEFPVTCQHTPRDASCKLCETCTSNTTSGSGSTFIRRQCSYEISYFSRLPSVIDTICDPCTNCTAQNEEFVESCSILSDATCKPRAVSPSASPVPSSASQTDIQDWKRWLFREQSFDSHEGPYLGKLLRRPIDIGSSFLAVLTIAFVFCLFRLSPSRSSSYSNAKQENSEDKVIHHTHNQHLPGNSTFGADEAYSSYTSSETLTTIQRPESRRDKLLSLIFSFIGLSFLFFSLSFVYSLPEELVTSVSVALHVVCGLGGVYFSRVFGTLFFRNRSRMVTSAPQRRESCSRYIAMSALLLSICSPLCLTLLVFAKNEFEISDIKRVEVLSGFVSILNALVQMVLFSVSVYYFQLSILLWPVFLTYSLSLITLSASIYLAQSQTLTGETEQVIDVETVTTDSFSETTTASNTIIVTQASSNPGTLEHSVLEETVQSIESGDLQDLDEQSLDGTEISDTYSFERNLGLSHIQIFSSACEEEDVTSFSKQDRIEDLQSIREHRVKKAGRRASAPCR